MTIPNDSIVKYENGKTYIAMYYRQPTDKHVEVPGGFYQFVCQRNVSLAWILEEHIDFMLSVKTGCCGNAKYNQFLIANEMQVRIWYGAGR